jgi:hypothetical protein
VTAQPSAEPSAETLAELARLHREIAEVAFALPGTVLERYTRCTSKNCRCKADPPQRHGPYLQWTRKVAGKTVTRRLTREQYERYQPWFDNARRLRRLTTQLEELSLRTAETAEGWPPQS